MIDSLVTSARAVQVLARTFGARGAARRMRYEARRAAGRFRVSPRRRAASVGAASTVYAAVGAWADLPADARTRLIARATQVREGRHLAYGDAWRPLPETSVAWRTHPVSGFVFPDAPWWQVPHLPREADIKDVWEPGRFGWVYDLIRAHLVDGDPSWTTTFESRLADWRRAARPFHGPHWACGQETAIRALALLHAEANLPLTPDATASVHDVLGASGERIADAIEYGLSQRNNHGISEAAGLVHVGLRLRRAHPDAERWVRQGHRWLTEQVRDQFAHDGWYAQHSFTYMRLALDQATVAQRALAAAGLSLPDDCLNRLRQSVRLLSAVVGGPTGLVPNHGANDGALVLPYASAPIRDFRPSLTHAAIVLEEPLPADIRPDAETMCWLGSAPVTGPARRAGVVRGESGWATARVGRVEVFLRAGTPRHRPSHLDALHIDVRCDDAEVITDAGSFAYNAPPPWKNGLATAVVHNGPVVNDREPAVRGPRFLWLSWPDARLVHVEGDATGAELRATLADAASGAMVVERRVVVTPDGVTVDDRLLVEATALQVTWLVHPDAPPVTIRTEGGVATDLVGDERDVAGWFSPTYGVKRPSRAVRLRLVPAPRDAGVRTVIGCPSVGA